MNKADGLLTDKLFDAVIQAGILNDFRIQAVLQRLFDQDSLTPEQRDEICLIINSTKQ